MSAISQSASIPAVGVDAVEVIIRRQAARMGDPAPGAEVLGRAFAAAFAAPDHKHLQPYRFITISGAARAALGELMASALRARMPAADAGALDKERGKPMRAAMVVIAAAKIDAEAKVPEIEQVLAAGAATENFILALHAQGFAAAWKTGDAAYCPVFKAGLGLAQEDHIVGILYVGTPIGPLPPRAPVNEADFVKAWTAPL